MLDSLLNDLVLASKELLRDALYYAADYLDSSMIETDKSAVVFYSTKGDITD